MREAKVTSVEETPFYRILAVGDQGTGKTSQINTLRGRKFCYLFDPNARLSLAPGIDYVEFLPDEADLDLSAKTLMSPDKQATIDRPVIKTVPDLYEEFYRDIAERRATGFFENYQWICVDSMTTLSDIVMDRILYLANRSGKHPEQADWTAEMNLMKNIVRSLTSMPINLFMTGHIERMKDDKTGKIHFQIVVTGKNRLRIPLRFSDTLGFYTDTNDKGVQRYYCNLVRDNDFPFLRSSLLRKGVKSPIDVTLDFSKTLEGQGLGGVLSTKGK